MLRRPVRPDVEEFIAARSDRLLRTAYLLTGDRERAERLLQEGLAQAWGSWSRGDLEPEHAVRTAMVRLSATWWHDLGRRRAEPPDPAWLVIGRLTRRQRAALVLRYVEGVSDRDAADVLGCSVGAVQRLVSRALAHTRFADPGAQLRRLAGHVPASGVADRIAEVEHRVALRRAWHRTEVVASLVVVTALAAVATAMLPTYTPPRTPEFDPDLVQPPPALVGYQLPPVLRRDHLDYVYFRSQESTPGEAALRVAVAPEPWPQVLAWVTPAALDGSVQVSVDGEVAARRPAGSFDEGVLLSPRTGHLVVVRATRPNISMRIGVAIYHSPRR